MRIDGYGIFAGNRADFVVLECCAREGVVQAVMRLFFGFDRDRRAFTRAPATLHNPERS